MGTRAQFFIYVSIKGILFLVYSSYSQWDGYIWINDVREHLNTLLTSRKGWTVSELVTEMSQKYKHEIYFGYDTEASDSVTLNLEKELDTLPEGMDCQKEYYTSYGYSITRYMKGCYYHKVLPETIANSVVSGTIDTEVDPSEDLKAKAALAQEKMTECFWKDAEEDAEEEE